ncbi:MAG: FG-GAP repeat domain-containing protein, partial [Bacteroidota bacterium]
MRNYLLLIFTIFLLWNPCSASAQSFSYQSSEIPPMTRSSIAFGDYDNDGDLDMVIGGMINAFEAATYLFENQEGTFVQTDTELPAISDGVVLFGDVDGDGYVDLFLSGNGNSEPVSALLMNTGDAFEETDTDIEPMGGYTDAAFGDYTNNGYLDLILSGDDKTFL